MVTQVVLLCGGCGSRLGHLTKDCPKPLLPVGGRPFMDLVINSFFSQGLTDFVLSAGYLGEQVHEAYKDWGQWHDLTISTWIEQERLGTYEAVSRLLQEGAIHADRIILANGDTLVRTPTRIANFSGKALAFRIGNLDCGIRLFRTDVLLNAVQQIPRRTTGNIEDILFKRNYELVTSGDPILPVKWQNLDKQSSMFIDIGTPENYERAKVIFR